MTERRAFASWLGETNDVTRMFLAAGQIPDLINLAGGLPDPGIWPVNQIADITSRLVRDHPEDTLGYGPIEGLPGLREVIAKRFSSEELHLTSDNVLITTGGMQALDLLGKVLLEEGSVIAAQSPTYLGAIDAWRPRRPAYRQMFLDSDNFSASVSLSEVQFGYTVPNFSNPSGFLVPGNTREALVEAAEAAGTWLVEDDPYGTLYYDAPALPRLLDLSARGGSQRYNGPVVYMGTLSKELVPGLRVGWIIAAPELISALTIAKQGSDMCTSGLCQRIAQESFATGLTDEILTRMLGIYRERRNALCTALNEHVSEFFDWQIPEGGMFVWARAKDKRLNTDRLLEQALKHGVCVTPGSVFDTGAADTSAIRINFTFNNPAKLAEGVRRLAIAASAVLNDSE